MDKFDQSVIAFTLLCIFVLTILNEIEIKNLQKKLEAFDHAKACPEIRP
jgi:hypothetical protein